MKRGLIFLFGGIAVAGCILAASLPVHAQTVLTDAQRSRIQANCTVIKGSLSQLRASDALLRVNRGQVYEALGTRWMGRFNTRLTSNAIDAKGLASLTKSYDDRLNKFRTDYDVYARQLETAIKTDCAKDPDGFHLAIEGARTKRASLNEDVRQLHAYIDDYRSGVVNVRTNFLRLSGEDK